MRLNVNAFLTNDKTGRILILLRQANTDGKSELCPTAAALEAIGKEQEATTRS